MNKSNIQIMRSAFLTSTPLIKVKDKDDGESYVVGGPINEQTRHAYQKHSR